MFFFKFFFSKAQNSKKNSTQKNIAWTWAMNAWITMQKLITWTMGS